MKHLLLVGLLAFTSNVFAEILVKDATNSGYYTNLGDRNGIESNIFAGTVGNVSYRNWISFDLTDISDEIISASLTIYSDDSNDDNIDFVWSEITTPLYEVFSDYGNGVSIYNNLRDGAVFASGTATSGGNDVYSLTNAALFSLNNANGYWVMGGAIVDDQGLAYGFTDGVGSGDFIRLTVETQAFETQALAVIPVPAAFWLFCSGLIGVVGFARRRQ